MEQNETTQAVKKQTSATTKILLVLVALLLVAVLGVGGFLIFRTQSGSGATGANIDDFAVGVGAGTDIILGGTPETVAEQLRQMQEKVAKGMLQMDFSTEMNFPDGKSKGTVYFGNSENNSYPAYVVISLHETGEIIYRSGIMPIGSHVESIQLSKNLSKGSYPATLTIIQVDEQNDNEEVGKSAFTVTINVAS